MDWCCSLLAQTFVNYHQERYLIPNCTQNVSMIMTKYFHTGAERCWPQSDLSHDQKQFSKSDERWHPPDGFLFSFYKTNNLGEWVTMGVILYPECCSPCSKGRHQTERMTNLDKVVKDKDKRKTMSETNILSCRILKAKSSLRLLTDKRTNSTIKQYFYPWMKRN